MTLRIGIDASNLRAGGGLTHLTNILSQAQPETHGFDRLVVWTSRETAERIESKPWIDIRHEKALDGSSVQRLIWRYTRLDALATAGCDLLFAPGGIYTGRFRPYVTMSRNMLPFEWNELRRYGLSKVGARLMLLRQGQLKSFANADGLIFISKYAREHVSKQRVLRRRSPLSTVIHHGVHTAFRQPPRAQRSADEFRDKPFRLLYVSIVDLYKHQWKVVDAVASLRRKGMAVSLDLVGPSYGPAMKRFNRSMEKAGSARQHIHYHGPTSHAELSKYYHSADAFVFASSCENMPNILVEAMAAGLPIACSERGPMPEILGSTGLFFDPESPATIARAIEELALDQALRQRLATETYERATRFNWERCATQTFGFLATVAKRSPLPGAARA